MILYRTEKQIYLFWDAWHIIMDGSSMTLFFNQFVRAYQGEVLTPEQLTQFDLSNYEQKYLKSAFFEEAQSFFDQKLSEHIFLSEPAFDHAENTGGVRKCRDSFRMLSNQGLTDRIDWFKNIYEITAAIFFMGAFADTLKQMTQNNQAYFLYGESGRHDLRLQNMLGQLVQHIPLTVSFEAKATVIECLQKMQTDFIESWSYDNYPFELLESKYGASSSIVFVYQGELKNGFSMLGHEIPMEFLVPQSIYYNLILCVIKIGNQYGFRVGYNMEGYGKNAINKLMNTYAQTIQRFSVIT